MNAFEKMIKIMRDEAKNGVPQLSYGLAVMTGTDTLSYNGLNLEADDVLFADHLKKKRLTKLDFEIKQESAIDEHHHYHKWKDKSEYIEPLKSGDIVFGFFVSTDDDEKFVVLARIK